MLENLQQTALFAVSRRHQAYARSG